MACPEEGKDEVRARKVRKYIGRLVILVFVWVACGGYVPGIGWGFHLCPRGQDGRGFHC